MKKLFLLIFVATFAYVALDKKTVSYPPGILVEQAPRQTTANDETPFIYKEYRITPLADFQLEAKVLAKERYYLGRESDLAPYDLAMGWGPMSNETVLEQISIRQSGRFYFWRVENFPIPRQEIEFNSANMHLIPSSPAIRDVLDDIDEGQLVRLSGRLVRVDADDGWHWVSSLSRDDTGNGACELIWVESLELI